MGVFLSGIFIKVFSLLFLATAGSIQAGRIILGDQISPAVSETFILVL